MIGVIGVRPSLGLQVGIILRIFHDIERVTLGNFVTLVRLHYRTLLVSLYSVRFCSTCFLVFNYSDSQVFVHFI